MNDDPSSRSLLARLKRAFNGTRPEDAPLTDEPIVNGAPDPIDASAFLVNMREFQDMRVDDVMVPRADIVAIEIETPLKELARVFGEATHSRLPVFRETLDDPVGLAHIKDVLGYMSRFAEEGAGAGPDSWADMRILPAIRRPLLYVPASMRAFDLLLKMQSRRMHMALVVDEFGGTDGLVTLEDLIEPIVGDIADEHDEAETPNILAKGPHCWEADARAMIEDLEEVVGCDIASEEEENDVDTLGGLVFHLAGRVPERGEVLAHPSGFEFEVLDSDPRRIKRLRVKPGTGSTLAGDEASRVAAGALSPD